MAKKFLISTPIYYINDRPHIGHAYTTIAADIMARWHRLKGEEVYFLTGTDENSQKTVEAAKKQGKDVKAYTDEMAATWRSTWEKMGLTFTDFIRTTEKRHLDGVNAFWKACSAKQTPNGEPNIYKGEYIGLYCDGCEAYKKPSDLVDGLCPLHKKPPRELHETNYFFHLEAYRDQLLQLFEANKAFIRPESRYNEVYNYVKDNLDPLSISRETAEWGIPVPEDSTQAIYVWFDALLNYATAVGYGWDEPKLAKWWSDPETEIIHLVGKDIIKFHCAIWPAMLMSAGVRVPSGVVAHGFFTIDGDKISKSLGNAIDPLELGEKYGFDALRYFIFREIPFGEDGDFNRDRLAERYKHDLANDLGNLLNRVLVMTEKYFEGKVPVVDSSMSDVVGLIVKTWQTIEIFLAAFQYDKALEAIWQVLTVLNQFVDTHKPWVLAKTDTAKLAQVMYTLLESLRQVGLMLAPFMPATSVKINVQLGLGSLAETVDLAAAQQWGGLAAGTALERGDTLFPQLAE